MEELEKFSKEECAEISQETCVRLAANFNKQLQAFIQQKQHTTDGKHQGTNNFDPGSFCFL